MTISKKLFLITALAIGIPFNTFTYDVVGLKKEVQLILDFATHADCYIENKGRDINLGSWLKNKIDRTYRTSSYDIVKIANIIETHNSTEELLKMEAKEHQIDQDIASFMTAGIAVVYVAMILGALLKRLNYTIDCRILSSEIRNLVLIDKLQQQINDLAQKKSYWTFLTK